MWLFVRAGQRKQTVSPGRRSCSGSIREDHTRLISALSACVERGEDEETEVEEACVWAATLTQVQAHFRGLSHRKKKDLRWCLSSAQTQHTTLASKTFWSKTKRVMVLCPSPTLTCAGTAIWAALWVGSLLVFEQSNALVG